MKVSVCQLDNRSTALQPMLEAFAAQLGEQQPDLLLLPEMCFHEWLAADRQVDRGAWLAAVEAHARQIHALDGLGAAAVIGTRPVIGDGGEFRNQAYLWTPEPRVRALHEKHYLPDEPGYWEASWYQRGAPRFETCRLGEATIGIQICTEMWFFEWARHFARGNTDLLCIPRATPRTSAEKWLAGGRAAAICSGAWCLSSNLHNPPGGASDCGGPGWIISPEGEVLALTDDDTPIVTLDLDLEIARAAKATYPRYVAE